MIRFWDFKPSGSPAAELHRSAARRPASEMGPLTVGTIIEAVVT